MPECTLEINDIVRVINHHFFLLEQKEGQIVAFDRKGHAIVRFGKDTREAFKNFLLDWSLIDDPQCILAQAFDLNMLEKIAEYSPETITERMFPNLWFRICIFERKDKEPIKFDGSQGCSNPNCDNISTILSIINQSGTVCFMPTCDICHEKYHGRRVDSL